MSLLQVRLLGAPEIRLDGRPLRFDTRKAVALVAYLAVTGRAHTREALAALLWPESDTPKARAALRRTLVTAGAVGGALTVDRSTIALDMSGVDCDVVSLRTAAAGASAEQARAALAVSRGDFLQGFSVRDSPEFEDWRTATADDLRRVLDRLLERLVDDDLETGDLTGAVALGERRVALDPLHEPAQQELIRLYAWNGQRAEALRQYRRCVRVLDRELGVAPLPETTAVYDDVRRQRLPKPDAPRPAPPAPPAVIAQEPIFVGRTQELALLAAAWQQAKAEGRCIAVVGEVGSGKTALLTAASSRAAAQGARVLTVRGHEGEQSLAYGAVTDLLRALFRSAGDLAARLTTADRAALGWLVPDLAVGPRTDGQEDDRPADRGRLFDALRTALVLAVEASGAGLVVVVEDVHWLDPESADLVAFLVRRPLPGLLLAVSWRGTTSPSAVAGAMAEALGEGRADVVRLTPLDTAATGELLAAYGGSTDLVHVAQVTERTGGLPLLVVEHARLGGAADSGDWRGLDALVRARIDAAPETTRQLVTAVAVVAAPVEPDLLLAVSGRGAQEVVVGLEDAVARGLLVELPGRAEYDVPHETLRRLAIDGASLARRRLLHGRTADALARQSGARGRAPGRAATIARHLELAGRGEEALGWHVAAAEEAVAVFAHATAEQHFASALALGHEPLAAHLGLGDARTRLGRYQEALASYEQAAASADSVDELATVEHRLADVRQRLGELDLAEGHLEVALALVADEDAAPVLRVRLLADLAGVSMAKGDDDAAAERARAAIAAADAGPGPGAPSTPDQDAHSDAAALAQAFDVLGILAAREGDVDAARSLLTTSLESAAVLADPGPSVAALNSLARVEADAGDLAAATQAATRALELGERSGDTHRTAALHTHLADLLHAAGRTEDAREHERRAAVLFAEVDRESERRPEIWKLVEW